MAVSRHSEIARAHAGNEARNGFGALLATSRRVEKPEAPVVKHDSLTNTHEDRSGTALEFTIGWDGW